MVVVKPYEPSSDEIQSLRQAALSKLNEKPDLYDKRDLERLSADDDYVRRFHMHCHNTQERALAMIENNFRWRKTNRVNDVKAEDVKKFMDLKNLFIHNRDKDGCKLLIFLVFKHFKGVNTLDEIKVFFIYWMERLEREEHGKWISIVFDMRDTGMKNMDIDLISYVINMFKEHYPWILNYILVLEMPWLLNAMWKIIKNMLPEESLEKIKFVDKKGLREYVAEEQALKAWGGTDEYSFVFEEEAERSLPWMLEAGEAARKQVKFCPESAPSIASTSSTDGSHVAISPSEQIMFDTEALLPSNTFTITNITNSIVYYMIKTTSPQKFKVRPSMGVLNAGGSSHVSVSLLERATPYELVREKFLVQSTPGLTPGLPQAEVRLAIKNAPKASVAETRLRVGAASSSPAPAAPPASPHDVLCAKVEELKQSQLWQKEQLASVRRMLLLLLVLVCCVLLLLLLLLLGAAKPGLRVTEL